MYGRGIEEGIKFMVKVLYVAVAGAILLTIGLTFYFTKRHYECKHPAHSAVESKHAN